MQKNLFFHKCSIIQTHLHSNELYTVFNKLEHWLCLGHFLFSLLVNLTSLNLSVKDLNTYLFMSY